MVEIRKINEKEYLVNGKRVDINSYGNVLTITEGEVFKNYLERVGKQKIEKSVIPYL